MRWKCANFASVKQFPCFIQGVLTEHTHKIMKRLLYEVSVIRPIVIILLLFMHCFTPYQGAWPEFEGFAPSRFYFWMAKFITGFRIETIALVAGYVFSYQCRTLGREYKFLPFVKKKALRLLLPCYVFGVVYYAIFICDGTLDIMDCITSVFKGAGHLWFLPMLFLCFVTVWLLDRYKPNELVTFVCLSLLSMVPTPEIFAKGLARYFHFALYVYAGYLLWIYRKPILKRLMNPLCIISLVVIYSLLVYCHECVGDIYVKAVIEYAMNMTGILSLYLTVSSFTAKPGFELSPAVISMSSQCYGLYVFHQFILYYLYYRTSFTAGLGYFTPWLAFVVTLSLSWLATKLFMRYRVGRFLIG